MIEVPNTPTFEEFCNDVCGCLGVAMPRLDSIPGAPPGIAIRYSGVAIAIMQASLEDAARGVFSVDFGEIPIASENQVYRSLLESNHVLAGTGGLVFGVNAADGHVQGQLVFELSKANPIKMCAALEDVVAGVQAWRTDLVDALAYPAVGRHIPADGLFA